MLTRVVFLACLGGWLFGYDLGLIGGAMLGISDSYAPSQATQEAIVGGAKLGAFAGTFLGGATMLRYGRRKAIALQALFFVAGPVIMALAGSSAALVAGRIVVGVGVGASAIVVPAFLAEIAPPSTRGSIVQVYEVMLTLGMVSAQLVNSLLAQHLDPTVSWRYMVGLPAAPGACLLLSLLLLPESPKWLVMRGELDAALATLRHIIVSKHGGRRGGSWWRRRQPAAAHMPGSNGQPATAAAAAAGLPQVAAPLAAASPDVGGGAVSPAASAGQPGTPDSSLSASDARALAEAEDELMWLWSSVQKERAAGEEMRRQAAAAAAYSAAVQAHAASSSGVSGQPPVQQQQQAPATASARFTLSEDDDARPAAAASDAPAVASADGTQRHRFKPAVGGGGSSSAAAAAAAAAAGDDERTQSQQLLLGPGVLSSSSAASLGQPSQQQRHAASSSALPPHGQQGSSSWWRPWRRRQQHPSQHEQQQHQHASSCEPGREPNLLLTLAAMLRDVGVVARGPERRAFGIACALAVFDQATASTAIINYAPLVLAGRLGLDSTVSIRYPAAISMAKAVGVLVALLLVDRWGRKPLLIWGAVASAAALQAAGWALLFNSVPSFLACLCVFIFAFSCSWAGLFWVVVSELFSMGAKAPAASAATALLFLTGAITNFFFLSLVEELGVIAFIGFACVAGVSGLYVWRAVPETKGRSAAEVQALLQPAGGAGGGGGAGPQHPPPHHHQPGEGGGVVLGMPLAQGFSAAPAPGAGAAPPQQQPPQQPSRLVEMRELMSESDASRQQTLLR